LREGRNHRCCEHGDSCNGTDELLVEHGVHGGTRNERLASYQNTGTDDKEIAARCVKIEDIRFASFLEGAMRMSWLV
jgi:hypothetical protein